MLVNNKRFSRQDLPFNSKMKTFWNKNGFLVINNFFTIEECTLVRSRAIELISEYNPETNASIFDTKNQEHANDEYFLDSGDKIRFFFENKAFDSKGNLTNSIELLINKIGHALHDLDPVFNKFSHREDLHQIAKSLDIKSPKLIQSMYIFKQPRIGGEVAYHQDSTFLYTKPESTVGFWIALEDAKVDNGCLWVAEGGHKGPLRELFIRKRDKVMMKTLDDTKIEKKTIPLEVKEGALILLHGRLPHFSCENKSNKSRHAYSIHIIDGECEYPKENWLQRESMSLRGFID